MKTHTELMMALKVVVDELRPLAESGDESAHVKVAMGEALYECMAEGYHLTDLDWFRDTSYYTGNNPIRKAA